MTDAEARERAAAMLADAGIVLTAAERDAIEVADFGLGRLEEIGLQIVVYVNTERVCAKGARALPAPDVPRAPPSAGRRTTRARKRRSAAAAGLVQLHVDGDDEIVLRPGEQCTIPPDTLHWFQAGDEGAVVSEFSTRSRDETDVFTDPRIVR